MAESAADDIRSECELMEWLVSENDEGAVDTYIDEHVESLGGRWLHLNEPDQSSETENTAEFALSRAIINATEAVIIQALRIQTGDGPLRLELAPPRYIVKRLFDYSIADVRGPESRMRGFAGAIEVLAMGGMARPCIVVLNHGTGIHPTEVEKALKRGQLKEPGDLKVQLIEEPGINVDTQRFCGALGYELFVSRRNPRLLEEGQADRGGFTVIRNAGAEVGGGREYLVDPDGKVPTFDARGSSICGEAAGAAGEPLRWGSYRKFFNFQLSRRGDATVELTRELNQILFAPLLPYTVIETRRFGRKRGERKAICAGISCERRTR